HSPDLRFQQKMGEPSGGTRATLCVLQLLPHSRHGADDARNGGWPDASPLGFGGSSEMTGTNTTCGHYRPVGSGGTETHSRPLSGGEEWSLYYAGNQERIGAEASLPVS